MLRGLRLQLTLLYTLAALALVLLVGGGAYLVVARYFRSVTDLALAHKMTHEFHALAAPIPPDLSDADRDWSIVRGELGLLAPRDGDGVGEAEAIQIAVGYLGGGKPRDVHLQEREGRLIYEVRFDGGARVLVDQAGGRVIGADVEPDEQAEHADDPRPVLPAATVAAYDAELAAIFVLPLDAQGRLLFDPNPFTPPLTPDTEALRVALAVGKDLRTVTGADGRQLRLLTYRVTRDDGPAALQLGRALDDQEQVLRQLTAGLLGLGALSIALVGVASWWLAGRALRPTQAAWERQQRFIASASHELRAPLTLIRASAEVALRATPAADPGQRELLGDVLAESDHMRRLVDDLLTLSRLDSGRLSVACAPLDIAQLLGDLQRQSARLGDERGLTIAMGAAEGVALADPDRLRQVLLILLDNAIRHTPAGGTVTLSARPKGREVLLGVRDTGSGIAPEHLPHIFERFYRADPARTRNDGGAGLGLSIARGLVEAMGGRIGAESRPGQGTAIWIALPAA